MITNASGIDVVVTQDFLKALVELGRLYSAKYVLRNSTATRKVLIKTGAKRARLAYLLTASRETPVTLKEGVSASVDGTPIPSINYNRDNPDNDTLTKIFSGPTFSGGKIIDTDQAGAGTHPGESSSKAVSEAVYYILKANQQYAFEFTPNAAGDTVLRLIYFEG